MALEQRLNPAISGDAKEAKWYKQSLYMDWGAKKKHTLLTDDGKITLIANSDLPKIRYCRIYMEQRAPKQMLLLLKSNENEILTISGCEVSKKRHSLMMKKTDENDARIIKMLVEEASSSFKEPKLNEDVLMELMLRYDKITSISIAVKNQYIAYVREFGDTRELVHISSLIDILRNEKARLLDEARPMIEKEYEITRDIKGLGVRYLAGILAYANPKKFRSVSSYLRFCGYKGYQFKVTHKWSRKIKPVVYDLVMQLLKQRSQPYSDMYYKFKEKYKSHGKAVCRVATLLLKELYGRFK